MLTTEETTKLYFTINKLLYKQSELGVKVYTKSRNPDYDSKEFQQIIEISAAIKTLLEKDHVVFKEGVAYPNFVNLEGNPLNQHLDYLTIKFGLDPVPYLAFPENTTTYIATGDTVSIGGGTSLPLGGGVDYYLTKNSTDNLIWKQISYFSDFNQI